MEQRLQLSLICDLERLCLRFSVTEGIEELGPLPVGDIVVFPGRRVSIILA